MFSAFSGGPRCGVEICSAATCSTEKCIILLVFTHPLLSPLLAGLLFWGCGMGWWRLCGNCGFRCNLLVSSSLFLAFHKKFPGCFLISLHTRAFLHPWWLAVTLSSLVQYQHQMVPLQLEDFALSYINITALPSLLFTVTLSAGLLVWVVLFVAVHWTTAFLEQITAPLVLSKHLWVSPFDEHIQQVIKGYHNFDYKTLSKHNTELFQLLKYSYILASGNVGRLV